MAAMVMGRVMGGENDGERKEGDEEKAVSFVPIAYTYLGTLVKNIKHAFLPKVCVRNCIELLLRRRELEIPF